jgi:hypothetical protein
MIKPDVGRAKVRATHGPRATHLFDQPQAGKMLRS